MADRSPHPSWQRGVASVVAIPALAFFFGKLPAGPGGWGLLARPALFAVVSVAILCVAGARLRHRVQWWRAVPIIIACVIARAVSDAPVQLIAITAFIAASEELVFRGLAVDAALGGRVTPERVLAASVVSSLAFATSHFAAGGVPWSTPAWWGYFGSGACLVLIRFEAGIETTSVLHFGINLLFATGYFGAQILPGYATLLAVAFVTPVVTAVVVPRGTPWAGGSSPRPAVIREPK